MARQSMFYLTHISSILPLTTTWTAQSIFLLHLTNFPPSYFSYLTILSDRQNVSCQGSIPMPKACENILIPSVTKVTKPTMHESYQLCSHLELIEQFKFSQNMFAHNSEHTVFNRYGSLTRALHKCTHLFVPVGE